MRARRGRCSVEWGHGERSMRKEGWVPHSRTIYTPWGTLDAERWAGTPLPGEMGSPGAPSIRKGGPVMQEAVVLMAKAPVSGRVKTRLCPPLAPAEAARLYACMLGDAAEEISSVGRIARYLFLHRPVAAHAKGGRA